MRFCEHVSLYRTLKSTDLREHFWIWVHNPFLSPSHTPLPSLHFGLTQWIPDPSWFHIWNIKHAFGGGLFWILIKILSKQKSKKSLQFVFAFMVSPAMLFLLFSHSAFGCPVPVAISRLESKLVVNHRDWWCPTEVPEVVPWFQIIIHTFAEPLGHSGLLFFTEIVPMKVTCFTITAFMNSVLVQNMPCHDFPCPSCYLSKTLL